MISGILTVKAVNRKAILTLGKAVSTEPTEDHNDPGEFSAMSAVPCYDSGSEDDDQEETLECFGE